jgi:methionine-rich copper-binding protein CopC
MAEHLRIGLDNRPKTSSIYGNDAVISRPSTRFSPRSPTMSAIRISALVGTLAAAAAFLAVAPAPAVAHPSLTASSDSVTGCLKKGDKPDTFSLTTQDGQTISVSSASVSLAGHVGHTVTLSGNSMTQNTGAISDSSKTSGMSDSMKMGNANGAKMMDVTKLTMVSPSCK